MWRSDLQKRFSRAHEGMASFIIRVSCRKLRAQSRIEIQALGTKQKPQSEDRGFDFHFAKNRMRQGAKRVRPTAGGYISFTPSTNAFSFLLREGCRSLRNALASICRIRSRVTWKLCPTSSRVCSEPSSRPKRILMTRSSRGVSVRSTCEVYSFRLTLITASEG